MRVESNVGQSSQKSAERSAKIVLLAILLAGGLFAPQAIAQGLYVPRTMPAGEFPANLENSHIAYDVTVMTDLPATDENRVLVDSQRFQYSISFSTGRGGLTWTLPSPSSSTWANVLLVNDWKQSRRIAPAAYMQALRTYPRATLVTQYADLIIRRPASDQVVIETPAFGPGLRFQRHPEVAAWIRKSGKAFQPWPEGRPRNAPAAGPAQAPRTLRLRLTDAQAAKYVAILARTPESFGAEMRLGAPRIALSFSLGVNPELPLHNHGPALRLDHLRITSKPLPGKPALKEIPFRAVEVGYRRARPTPEKFAELLGTDMWDPECIDRFNRCPRVLRIPSRFSHLPDGTAIRSGEFPIQGGALMNTDRRYTSNHPWRYVLGQRYFQGPPGKWIPCGGLLYEDSLNASLDVSVAPKVVARVLQYPVRVDLGTPKPERMVIGHYYYVFDGLRLRKAPTNAGGVKTKISITRSSYANTMRSTTKTTAIEVSVSASGGLKDVFDVGVSVTGSESTSNTVGASAGKGRQETHDLEIEVPRHFSRGTLTILQFPVFVNVTRRGTSRWVVDAKEKVTFGGSARITEYALSKGILRYVDSETDADDADKTRVWLGKEISGGDRHVVLAMFPNLKRNMTNNPFAGRWRQTNLTSGDVEVVSVGVDGMVKAEDDDKPSRKIVRTGDGKATITQLDDNQVVNVLFKIMKSWATSALGDDSKIAFYQEGRQAPLAFWIKVDE